MPNVATLANPKGVNANNAHRNDRNNNHDRNQQQDRNYRNNQDNRNNQQCNHRYPTRSQQQREESHQQQEASDDRSQHTTNHSESDDEIFALEEKRNIKIKTSSPNKTTYRKLPSVYSPTSLQNDTSISEP
jgi:hypothetical protein